ncbi:MAG TPA: hypothetical protein PK228_19545, partial [Saprospiraceae bacterium]|nr:hypothetical protein [Saprospiraceae bacterium]
VGFSQASMKAALDEVARLGGFEWSYNARILDESRRVSLPTGTRTVRETLVLLLGDDYTFRQNGDYLILKRNKKPQQRLSGYLSDPSTGKKIPNATIYDRQTLRSTTTDSSGFYELPVGPRSEIVISKLDYRDTVLQVTSQTPRFVQLELSPDSLPGKSYSSIRKQVNQASYALEQFFVKTSQSLNALNVEDSLHRRFQISLLPGIGTNHRLSGSVVNDFSVNVLAGYSRGNRILEVAGLGNITRENMTGVQAAGMFNNLRGNATGFQAAGIYNYVGDTLSGVQASGVVNVAGYGKDVAFQAAGVLNLVPHGRFAVQAAGVANQTDTVTALQAAGIWNGAKTLLNGVQAAGVANHAGRADAAAQFAGLTNSVGSGKIRVQVAALANVADTLHGAQVSGFFNSARHLRGAQIGLVNVAGKNQGVQIGLLNFSQQGGYIALEASANDVLWANLAFKSGSPRLYVTLTGGVDSFAIDEQSLWAFWAGLGAYGRLAPWCGLNFDLTHRHLSVGYFDDAVQEWEQFALGLDLRVAGGLHLFGGPTFNLLITDPDDPESPGIRSRVVKNNVLPDDAGDGWLSGWVGWTAGVRWRF